MMARVVAYPVVFLFLFVVSYAIASLADEFIWYHASLAGALYSLYLDVSGLFVYFIIPSLFIFMAGLRCVNLQKNLLLTLATSALGVAIPMSYLFGATTFHEVAQLFVLENTPFPPFIPEPALGLFVIASACVAWLFIFKVTPISKYF